MTVASGLIEKPRLRPLRPEFSSGPCAKHPGFDLKNLQKAVLGRSHRSKPGKARLKLAIDQTRKILEVPENYKIGIVAGSDTGAVEMALWSLLGPRPVELLAFESFGKDWVTDVTKQLKLKDVTVLSADYGALPDLEKISPAADLVFTLNGTTSGVRLPNLDFIAKDRQGLSICDATSAAFAQRLDWEKLDVVTFSWQKVLGGEAAHGVLILSPRAIERLESYTPPWPLPKLFRLTKSGKLIADIFEGATINTPSMLCVEDYIDSLNWAESLGGLSALHQRCDHNLDVISQWVDKTPWVHFLAEKRDIRSNTSVCLKIVDPLILSQTTEAQEKLAKTIVSLLESEGVAFDIGHYRDAPPGLRIWCGATVETDDLKALTPWLDWAFATAVQSQRVEA